jgi:hypothetical protein
MLYWFDTYPGGTRMSNGSRRISLDWWTVIAALAAAGLIKAGLIPNVPW